MSQVESGKLQLDIRSVSPYQIVENSVIAVTTAARQKEISIKTKLASDLPEIKKIVTDYNIGMIASSHDPQQLAAMMKELMSDSARLQQWKQNAISAAADLNWEKEKSVLTDTFKTFD